jgi:hypothetical protein
VLVVDAIGRGELRFSSEPEEGEELLFPSDLLIKSGSVITIGDSLTGTFGVVS